MSVPLKDQLACARRELALRRNAYPKWVASGRWKQRDADRELERMAAMVATLERQLNLEEASNQLRGGETLPLPIR